MRNSWSKVIILSIILLLGTIYWKTENPVINKAKAQSAPIFTDVPADYWAYNQIQTMAAAGFMKGYPTASFLPDESATRAVVAAVVSRSYNQVSNPANPTFQDVPVTYWAYQNIEGLKAAGYMIGESPTTFNPDGIATRQVLAAVIARAHAGGDANVPAGPATSPFSDVLPTDPLYKYICYANSNGLMVGNNGLFNPADPATRAMVAAAVSRAKLGSQSAVDAWPLPAWAPTFTDVLASYPLYKNIEYVNAQGYMVGQEASNNRLFKPTEMATRAQAAVVISKAMGLAPLDSPTPAFSDVPKEYSAYKEIEAIRQAGVMSGFADGTFHPNQTLTRREIAVILYNAKQMNVNVAQSSFSDVPVDDPALNQIEGVYLAGYTTGCGTNPLRYCPNDGAQRDVLAVFVYNAYLKVVPDGFRILKSVDLAEAHPGDKLTYTIAYQVGDQTVNNIVGDDPLPGNVTYDTSSILPSECVYQSDSRNIHCNLATLAANTTGVVSFSVTVNP